MQIDASTRVIYHNPAIQAARLMATYGGADTWWDGNGTISGCVGAWQAIGAASLAASYTDLSGNGNDITAPVAAPTFNTATGWTFNGSTQYLSSNYTISDATAATVIIRFSNAGSAADTAWMFGTSWYGYAPKWFGTSRYRNGNTSSANGGGSRTAGVAAVNASNGYWNGSSDATMASDGSEVAQPFFIGAITNSSAVASAFCAADVQAIAVYNVSLSGADIGTITTAMAAL